MSAQPGKTVRGFHDGWVRAAYSVKSSVKVECDGEAQVKDHQQSSKGRVTASTGRKKHKIAVS